MNVKVDKNLLKFYTKFDKVSGTSNEIFEKFVWNFGKILFAKFSNKIVLNVSKVKFIINLKKILCIFGRY